MHKDGMDRGSFTTSAGVRLSKAAAESLSAAPCYTRPLRFKTAEDKRLDAIEARLAALERKVAKTRQPG